MMLNGRGAILRGAVTPFWKLFNRSAASSSARTSNLFIGGKIPVISPPVGSPAAVRFITPDQILPS
jgi:hypothetical protein